MQTFYTNQEPSVQSRLEMQRELTTEQLEDDN